MKRLSATAALFAAVTLTAAEYAWTGTNEPRPDAPSASSGDNDASKIKLPAAAQTGYTENFAASFAEFLSSINAIADPSAIAATGGSSPAANRAISSDINPALINAVEHFGLPDGGSRLAVADSIAPALLSRATGIPPYSARPLAAVDDGYLNDASQSGSDHSRPIPAAIAASPAAQTPSYENIAPSNTGPRAPAKVLQANAGDNPAAGPAAMSSLSAAALNPGSITTGSPVVGLASDTIFSGNGTYTSLVTLDGGAHLIPGSIGSIAELHLHGGVIFKPGSIWHIDIATAASDRICVWDNLSIQGDPLTPITVNVYSINAAGGPGALYNFDPAQPHTWTIAYRANNNVTITGFDPAYFAINADVFFSQNPALLGLGDFSVEKIGNTLALTFTPVPEPGIYALMGFGLAALALIRHRRRR